MKSSIPWIRSTTIKRVPRPIPPRTHGDAKTDGNPRPLWNVCSRPRNGSEQIQRWVSPNGLLISLTHELGPVLGDDVRLICLGLSSWKCLNMGNDSSFASMVNFWDGTITTTSEIWKETGYHAMSISNCCLLRLRNWRSLRTFLKLRETHLAS